MLHVAANDGVGRLQAGHRRDGMHAGELVDVEVGSTEVPNLPLTAQFAHGVPGVLESNPGSSPAGAACHFGQ